jgi:hypothetical protein
MNKDFASYYMLRQQLTDLGTRSSLSGKLVVSSIKSVQYGLKPMLEKG